MQEKIREKFVKLPVEYSPHIFSTILCVLTMIQPRLDFRAKANLMLLEAFIATCASEIIIRNKKEEVQETITDLVGRVITASAEPKSYVVLSESLPSRFILRLEHNHFVSGYVTENNIHLPELNQSTGQSKIYDTSEISKIRESQYFDNNSVQK